MLSIFRREQPAAPAAQAANPSRRMSLEERMAWRREMLYHSVREQMLELEVLSGMYKFRAMALDARQHRYALMVDVTRDFRAQRDGELLGFHAVEAALRQRCLQRHGLGLDAVYWRVHAQNAPFERRTRTGDAADPAFSRAVAERQPPQPAMAAGRPLSRVPQQPVADEDQQAFEDALRRGLRPPPLRVGSQSYQSDLAPLESLALPARAHDGGW